MPLTKDLPCKLSIGYPSRGTDSKNEQVRILVEDRLSGVAFLEINLSFEQLAMALASRAARPVNVVVRALDKVGMKIVREPRVKEVDGHMTRSKAEAWLLENAQEPGWTINTYLGTQNSVLYNYATGKTTLRYSAVKWVEPAEQDVAQAQQENDES